jgi:ribosomal-protein-alanine N-acetyltransferase
MYKGQAQGTKEEKELFCNVCGKKIVVEQGILKEDVMEVSKEWGYFSKKDLEVHKFNICEDCYETMISTFKIPIEIINKKEVL